MTGLKLEFSIFPLDEDSSFSGCNATTQTKPATNARIRNQRKINKTSSSEIAGQRSHFISISAHLVVHSETTVRQEHQKKTFRRFNRKCGFKFQFRSVQLWWEQRQLWPEQPTVADQLTQHTQKTYGQQKEQVKCVLLWPRASPRDIIGSVSIPATPTTHIPNQ